MSEARLRTAARVDRKTLAGLLDGTRWPQEETRLKIETALDWEPGSIQALREGRNATPRRTEDVGDRPSPLGGPLAEVPTSTLTELMRDFSEELRRRLRADPDAPPL